MKYLKIFAALCLLLVPSVAMATPPDLETLTMQITIGILVLLVILLFQIPAIITIACMNQVAKPYQDLPNGKKYAGYWRRVAAILIDILILLPISISSYYIREHTTQEWLYWSLTVASALIGWFYTVLLQGSKHQATLGMRVMKCKIYDKAMNKVGFWRLSGRYWSTTMSTLILFFGFFMIGWTKRKQGLHDMITRTVYVKN